MKKSIGYYLAIIPLLALAGAGTAFALKSLTKEDEIKLKQQLIPKNAQKATELVGIFAPGFETELEEAKTSYSNKYGNGNFHVLTYNGYTLLVPPGTSSSVLTDVRAQVDRAAVFEKNSLPNAIIQSAQIAKIREVFNTAGEVVYDPVLRAYTDDKGFQYNFMNGVLVSKQVGITSALHAKFEKAYPHLQSDPQTASTPTISPAQAQFRAEQVLSELFSTDRVNALKNRSESTDLGNSRIGFTFGDKEVHILVDQVTGDIINFNEAN